VRCLCVSEACVIFHVVFVSADPSTTKFEFGVCMYDRDTNIVVTDACVSMHM
jgi:hypothetical protein